jgi:hypothetical protein
MLFETVLTFTCTDMVKFSSLKNNADQFNEGLDDLCVYFEIVTTHWKHRGAGGWP